MSDTPAETQLNQPDFKEVRYSLSELLQEVQAEREGSTLGQEIVDQSEITKLFKGKKKVSRGKKGK